MQVQVREDNFVNDAIRRNILTFIVSVYIAYVGQLLEMLIFRNFHLEKVGQRHWM